MSSREYDTPLVAIVMLLIVIALTCLIGVAVRLEKTNDLLEQIRDRLPAVEKTGD